MTTPQSVQKEVREQLAELEHEQWIAWSKDIAETETITEARIERWKELWCPYSELTEAQKDQDREWGDKAFDRISASVREETLKEAMELIEKEMCLLGNTLNAKDAIDSVIRTIDPKGMTTSQAQVIGQLQSLKFVLSALQMVSD